MSADTATARVRSRTRGARAEARTEEAVSVFVLLVDAMQVVSSSVALHCVYRTRLLISAEVGGRTLLTKMKSAWGSVKGSQLQRLGSAACASSTAARRRHPQSSAKPGTRFGLHVLGQARTFSGDSLMRLRMTYTNWPTVRSEGTRNSGRRREGNRRNRG